MYVSSSWLYARLEPLSPNICFSPSSELQAGRAHGPPQRRAPGLLRLAPGRRAERRARGELQLAEGPRAADRGPGARGGRGSRIGSEDLDRRRGETGQENGDARRRRVSFFFFWGGGRLQILVDFAAVPNTLDLWSWYPFRTYREYIQP